MKSVTKEKSLDFIVLVLRWYLACYMISYGRFKVMGEQFGIHDSAILDQSLKEIDKFYSVVQKFLHIGKVSLRM